jgi:lipopolysaccharide transport system permease protein
MIDHQNVSGMGTLAGRCAGGHETPPAAPTLIRPSGGWPGLDLAGLWAYRELLFFLTWRDVKVRYKQTALGAAWAILQPLLTMVVFTIFFGRLAGIESRTGGVPYPIFVFAGLLPWMFFSNAVLACGNSLVGNTNLITKIYFPRIIIPLTSVGTGLVDLAVSSSVMLVLIFAYRIQPSWSWLLMPGFLLGFVLAAAGVGMVLAALTVSYRDFRYVVPFLTQLWMFLTPVLYPTAIVPERWRPFYYLNPMAGLIDGFRMALTGRPLAWAYLVPSLGAAAIIFLAGAACFSKMEDRFADLI